MSRSPTTVELEATGVRYFSRGDEDAFFAWLNKLPCVVRCEGHLRTVYITVDPTAVDQDGLRELLALFRRYGVGLRQLAVFDRSEFRDWFRNKQAFWYEEIFG